MLESLISRNEGKTLEFKENLKGLPSIMKAIIAFANTSGGTIVIGVTDGQKRVVGVENPLKEEERLASCISDSIAPLLIPDIQVISMRNKELLVIQVPHVIGPFYLKSVGMELGTYVRIGSTNRRADSQSILSLQMLAKNTSFDELPCVGAQPTDISDHTIQTYLSTSFSHFTKKHYESLNILSKHHSESYPTNGGILLFSQNRFQWFPDASIACVCFADKTHEEIIDQQEITSPLIIAHEEVLAFIKRNTRLGAKIQDSIREDISQYPPQAIREAVINAIVHADYSMHGARIHVAVFSNRIEITNPGGLPYGQTIELALSGVSLMRNRMMGRIFREVKLIERLGTGLKRIVNIYEKTTTLQPSFEEINMHFRVILYGMNMVAIQLETWETQLIDTLKQNNKLSTTDAAELWKVTTRTARTRLKKMIDANLIHRVATSLKDPFAVFKLNGH